MLVSILHRVTGSGLATLGLALMTWWLIAAAMGPAAYESFSGWASWPPMLVIWVGLTWAFWQHTLSGLRHFVMDVGAGYELKTNKRWAVATVLLAIVLTALTWAYLVIWRMA